MRVMSTAGTDETRSSGGGVNDLNKVARSRAGGGVSADAACPGGGNGTGATVPDAATGALAGAEATPGADPAVDAEAAAVGGGAAVTDPTFVRSNPLADASDGAGRTLPAGEGDVGCAEDVALAVRATAVVGAAVRSCWKPGFAIGFGDGAIVVVGAGVVSGRVTDGWTDADCAGRIGGTAGRTDPGGTSSAESTVGRGTVGPGTAGVILAGGADCTAGAALA